MHCSINVWRGSHPQYNAQLLPLRDEEQRNNALSSFGTQTNAAIYQHLRSHKYPPQPTAQISRPSSETGGTSLTSPEVTIVTEPTQAWYPKVSECSNLDISTAINMGTAHNTNPNTRVIRTHPGRASKRAGCAKPLRQTIIWAQRITMKLLLSFGSTCILCSQMGTGCWFGISALFTGSLWSVPNASYLWGDAWNSLVEGSWFKETVQ